MSPHPPPFMPFPFLLLLLLNVLAKVMANSQVSGEYDCDAHVPVSTKACLPRLRTHPSEYGPCKNSICYLFLEESPFIIFDRSAFPSDSVSHQLQSPFPCGDPTLLHHSLHGLAFDFHNRTSSRNSLCIWAGPAACTFNALVDFTAQQAHNGYQFAITGLLLETPQRQCVHEPSAPLIDNQMVVIGRADPDSATSRRPLHQLTKPFRWTTWGVFGIVILLFVFVSIAIAVRFHVVRGRSLVTAFFIFAGEREQAMAHEFDIAERAHGHHALKTQGLLGWSLHRGKKLERIDEYRDSVAFATKYGLSMTLFRIALLAFIAVFALFYEVAVVNFLFQQNSLRIEKGVRNLSTRELNNFAVLKNSALENVWNATVNPRQRPYDSLPTGEVPWEQCDTGTDCIQLIANESNLINFDVTFEVLGKFLVKDLRLCDKLTIFETKDILYHFNGGWLYNSRCDSQLRKQIDREIISLKRNGTFRELIDSKISDGSCSGPARADIGPLIVLVPCCLFVFPPLFCAILVLFCRSEGMFLRKNVQKDDCDDESSLYDNETKNTVLGTLGDNTAVMEEALSAANTMGLRPATAV